MTQRYKTNKQSFRRYSPSPIPQVEEANSTSFDTTANTIKPFEIFEYLPLRRKSYAFQLMKQFILFSSQSENSFEDDYDDQFTLLQSEKKTINLQSAQMQLFTVFSVIKRVKQKLLLSSYDKLKKNYFRKKMVYRNKQYVDKIVTSIANLIKDQHKVILQHVFIELIHNLKVCRTQELAEAKYRQTPKTIEYEDRNFKVRDNFPFHIEQQSGIFKNDTQSFFQSDSRIQIAKDFGIKKYAFSSQQTPHKQSHYLQQVKTVRQPSRKANQSTKKQNIYLIQSESKGPNSERKKSIKRFIKVAVETQNINIVHIESSRKSSKQKRPQKYSEKLNETTKIQKQNCSECEFCKKSKFRQQAMLKLKLYGINK